MSVLVQTVKNWLHLLQAIVAVIYFRYPANQLIVIGVTGTDGKTTTSTLIYHFLKSAGYQVALISTVAAYIGEEQIDTGFHVTSPASWQLQRLLRRIADRGFTHVVLESTSHGLDQHRLFGTRIQTAVVTNITHEHLDYHKTYDRYVAAKATIFKSAKTVVLNQDDQSYSKLLPYLPTATQLVTYSLQTNPKQSLFSEVNYQEFSEAAKKRFTEQYNQSNALAAGNAARALGISTAALIPSLKTFPGIPGRMQVIENHQNIVAIVDFAHTPNALKETLTAAKKLTKGKLIVIFGAAGARDVSKRPLMGRVASELADEIILTAEDPRYEDVRLIINQIKAGATGNRGHIHAQPDRRQAIRFGISLAQAGDVVIVCGKGHEQSLNLDGKHELPWSDVQVFQEELR